MMPTDLSTPSRPRLPSPTVRIVVDSAASLPPEMAEAPGIHVVPMRLRFGDRSYLDGIDLSPADFYRMLSESDTPPTTSAPSPAMFREAFERAGREGADALCLTVAARFSASYSSAGAAAEEYRSGAAPAQVLTLDTESAAAGQGLVALEAWRAARRGDSLHEVAEAARKTAARVRLLAAADTLYYLWRSGRVPRIAHAGASLLDIKPIFELVRGEVRARARPRSRRRAVQRLVELVCEHAGDREVHAAVMHAGALRQAEELRRLAERTLSCREVFVSEVTPVMGAHIGPGLLGIAYC